ncbi:ras-domain-containing protein, partial [Mycena rebaudengoi]
YVLKFIITGDVAVGKSSLFVRLTGQRFLANPSLPCFGVEFGSKLVTLRPDSTAGTESFRSLTRSYYRGAAGCLLVYDVTSRQSFENVRMWPGDVREHADKAVNCILVGNKRDLCKGGALSFYCVIFFFLQAVMHTDETKREVPTEDAERFAKEEGLLFVEASAKSGDNVEDAFARAASDILDKVRNGAFDDNKSLSVNLSPPGGASMAAAQKARSCCWLLPR